MQQLVYEYLAFEVLAGARTGDGYPVTVVRSPAGEGDTVCRLAPSADLGPVLAALEAADAVDAAMLEELGSFLFGELFSGAVGELYHTSLNIARSQGKGLRVRLRFAAPELASLPWEYLYDPSEQTVLATAADTALVRYVPLRVPARATTVQGPLRVLAVIAGPDDLPPLDIERERANLHQALANAVAAGRVDLQFAERSTIAAVNQAMRSFRPHIFHFVGHSLFRQGRAYVVLEDEDGHGQALDESAFQAFFAGAQETRLVVLNACQSAAVARDQPLAGLAPHLLQRQLAAVVGMQFPIRQETALLFAREFYRCVTLGYPIDAAVSEARKVIYQEVGAGRSDWGIPVLFLRAEDGQLFQAAQSGPVLPTVAPPPEPLQPPDIEGFVGREAELALYAAHLAQVKLAVITGMAGVGKTALAAALARQQPEARRVFWHSFREGEGVAAITWKLAAFLAHDGQDGLWRLLEVARQTGGQPPPPETTFDYLLQLVRGRGYVLCFDDFHHVDDDPLLNQLVERLRTALAAGELAIIITGRRMPEFVHLAEFLPLAGMNLADMGRFLRLHGVELDGELQEQLHTATGGNAEFLVLALDALRQAREPRALIGRLAETDDMARYLMREVDDGLSASERAVMGTVAVMLAYGATREAIEAVLDAGSVLRLLRSLADRHLLMVQQGPAGREYVQHAIVQGFYYDATGQRQRRQLHRRAGDYYANEEPDRLRAALHYERCGEISLAAAQATGDVWGFINQGRARALAGILQRLAAPAAAQQLSTGEAARVGIARGLALGFLGERTEAAQVYGAVLESLEGDTNFPGAAAMRARALRGMGELVEDESPQEALAWYRRGLAENAAEGAEDGGERGALLIKCGMAEMYMGNYTEARTLLEDGLARLPRTAAALQATGAAQLGVIELYTGDSRRAQAYTEQALTLSRQAEDHFLTALILGNLGMVLHTAGDWTGGVMRFEEALAWFERLGSEKQKAYAALNLGVALLQRGDLARAEQQLAESNRLALQYGDQLSALKAQYHLAELRLYAGYSEEAEQRLATVETLAGDVEDPGMLVWIYAAQAEAALARGRSDEAEALARRAAALGTEIGADPDKAIGLRALGSVLAKRGDLAGAASAFAESVACLHEDDPYEEARTQAAWGAALWQAGDREGAQAMLETAGEVLRRLGADYDLARLNDVMAGQATWLQRSGR